MTETVPDRSGLRERFGEHLDEVDEDWHDTFGQLVGEGHSPSGVKASIEYVTTPRTQDEVAASFDVSVVTIRNLYHRVVALGPITESESHGAYSKGAWVDNG